ncbi:hypothetical protein C3489_10860 [Streptomyces sp. Ru71]|nr:hypothetical protein C3489_10860 [Streptomyces sp. Ru71]
MVFDRDAYTQRNTVGHCINELKQWRGLATRYDKTATVYSAGLHLAAILVSEMTERSVLVLQPQLV